MSENKALVRRQQSLPRRFYKNVDTEPEGDGIAVLLDGKPIRTPAKAKLSVSSQKLAEAIAEEWRAQEERIDPETMRLTKLANSAIDEVRGREGVILDDLIAFAGSDLLCYRAEGPEALIGKQNEHWNPVLDWAKRDLSAPLKRSQGIVHITQPQSSLDRLRERLGGIDVFGLAALHVITTLTGSALLALAVALKRLTPDEAWAAAHVDEDWQISQWGEDAEAAARRTRRRQEFDVAANMLRMAAANENSPPASCFIR
jgi:chaperone required for assembly of F1-ATPase